MNFAYVRLLLATAFLIVCLAGLLNYVVDPAGIYREPGWSPRAYAYLLHKAEYGLWAPSGKINERLLAKEKCRYLNSIEGVVIGSSHVMSISSLRIPPSLHNICQSIQNLGVSGGSIEDHLTLAYLALRQVKQGKKCILGIDPWTFAFGKDARYSTYRNDYDEALAEILLKTKPKYNLFSKIDVTKLSNLVNLEYTARSIKTAFNDYKSWPPIITQESFPNMAIGGKDSAYLKDGSIVYSAKYIADCNSTPIPIGGLTYKTDSPCNTKEGIEAYRFLLLWIKDKGAEPILLMTPYHENVWKAPSSLDVVAMRATEIIVLKLARELNLRVVGSFDPVVAGCQPSDFYDCMHTKPEGLAKLKIRTIATQ